MAILSRVTPDRSDEPFGFIFWMLLACYLCTVAADADNAYAALVLTAAACCGEYMSLWSYDSPIQLIVLFPLVLRDGDGEVVEAHRHCVGVVRDPDCLPWVDDFQMCGRRRARRPPDQRLVKMMSELMCLGSCAAELDNPSSAIAGPIFPRALRRYRLDSPSP